MVTVTWTPRTRATSLARVAAQPPGECRILDLDGSGTVDATDATLFDDLTQGLARHPDRTTTAVDFTFGHQGLWYDAELESYQNRRRQYAPEMMKFMQRDPLAFRQRAKSGYRDGLSFYEYVRGNPLVSIDPKGLGCQFSFGTGTLTGSSPVGKCGRSCTYTYPEISRATVATASCGTMTCAEMTAAGLLPPEGTATHTSTSSHTDWCCVALNKLGFDITSRPSCPTPSSGPDPKFCEGPLADLDFDCTVSECITECETISDLASAGCDLLPQGYPRVGEGAVLCRHDVRPPSLC